MRCVSRRVGDARAETWFLVRNQVSQRPGRRGYLYVSVLATASIVAVVGLAAVSVAHLQLRTASQSNDWSEAQSLARAAIEDGTFRITADDTWRTTYNEGTEYPDPARSLGRGSYSWKLIDADGDLADDDSDSVELVGIGRVGEAVVAESVRLYPTGQPLSCLEASFQCHGDVNAGWTVNMTTNQFVSSNANISATSSGSSISGSAQAVGTVSGTVTGTTTTGIVPRRMPGSSAFEYYRSNGVWIDVAGLPASFGSRQLKGNVLSPSNNPWGAASPEGIYVVDCGGENLAISDMRIVGTLVLLNPGPGTAVWGAVRWDAAVTNYPALLVDGDLEFRFHNLDLDEAVLSVNFNPVGTPYNGDSDSDLVDKYPSQINGLVYVSGELDLPGDLADSDVRGVVVCNTSKCSSDIEFTYRSTYKNYPPPGFAFGNPMVISPGSWRRTAVTASP